jgi:plasmid stabilization system protein ParE
VRTVLWADRALADFNRQIEYIAAASPKAARLVAERLHKAIDNLARIASGRFGRLAGTYEKFVPKTSLILVYTKDDNANTITVVRIIHTSREWLDGTLPD